MTKRPWEMTNKELELEANRRGIEEYANADGTISRERIVEQIFAQDTAERESSAERRESVLVKYKVGSFILTVITIALALWKGLVCGL